MAEPSRQGRRRAQLRRRREHAGGRTRSRRGGHVPAATALPGRARSARRGQARLPREAARRDAVRGRALVALAQAQGVTLFASWHSRHAACVAQARAWLEGRTCEGGHRLEGRRAPLAPGPDLDLRGRRLRGVRSGINALSILTEIVRDPILLTRADLKCRRTARRRSQRHWRSGRPRGRRSRRCSTLGKQAPSFGHFRRDRRREASAQRRRQQAGDRRRGPGLRTGRRGLRPLPAFRRSGLQPPQRCRPCPLRLVADAFLSGHNRTTDPFDD